MKILCSILIGLYSLSIQAQNKNAVLALLSGWKQDFQNSTNDSLFCIKHSEMGFRQDTLDCRTFSHEKCTALAQAKLGAVIGPFADEAIAQFSSTPSKTGYAMLYKVLAIDSCMEIKASHIYINEHEEKVKGESEKTAQKLYHEILAGKSFEKLARKFSDDGSSVSGGDLGWFKEGIMVQPFNDACFKAKTNDLFVVHTVYGYHVVKITAAKRYVPAVFVVIPIIKSYIDK